MAKNFLLVPFKRLTQSLMKTPKIERQNIPVVDGNYNEDTLYKSKQIVSRNSNNRLGDRIVLKQQARTG